MAITLSEFLAAGSFSNFFNAMRHLLTRCLCNAEVDMVKTLSNVSQDGSWAFLNVIYKKLRMNII